MSSPKDTINTSIASFKVHRVTANYNVCPKKFIFKNNVEYEEWINNTVNQHGIYQKRESRKSISSSSTYTFEKFPSARVFLHSEYYLCQHAGKKRRKANNKNNINLNVKRRCVKRKSVKDGCTAKFNKRYFSDGSIEVIYNWKHTTHDPCSVEDISRSRLPKRVHDWIHDCVNQQMTWKSIKPLLKSNDDQQQLDNNENDEQQSSSFSASELVNYNHIKNAIRNHSNISPKDDSSDTESEDWNYDSTQKTIGKIK